MQTFGSFLVAVLAASAELAAAAPSQQQPNAVVARSGVPSSAGTTVKVRPRQNTYGYRHPALAMAKAVRKFSNNTMPAHLDRIVKAYRGTGAAAGTATKRTGPSRRAASGSATTTPEANDEAYITNIQVGTPAQTLPMDFDTGSSDLWVFSSETPTNEVNGQKTYNIKASTSAKQMTGATWKISYGDGSSSSGNVYTDVVTIGNVSVTAQAVESATSVSDEFTADSSSSGLVGLAMSSLNTVSPAAQKTFFDNARSQLAAGVFSVDLKHDVAGTYTFGAVDTSAFTGTMNYVNLDNTTAGMSGYWTFQATGYTIGNGTTTGTAAATTGSTGATTNTGGKKGGKNNNNNAVDNNGSGFFRWARSLARFETVAPRLNRHHAGSVAAATSTKEKRAGTATTSASTTVITGIADTGTTLAMLPDAVVADYYSQVSGASDSTTEGGYVFPCASTLPDFSFGVGSGSVTIPGSYINWAALDATNTTCYGGIQSDASIGFSIFGDIALKAAYVVFDGAEGRLGWAAKTLTT